MKRKILSVAMALLLVCAMPLSVMADEWDLAQGDITVSVTESGTQNVAQNAVSKEDSNPTISSSSQTSNTITVETKGDTTANITIDNVNINTNSGSGIDVGDSNLNLTVSGTNTVETNDFNAAGIHVSSGDLTITGDGQLDVTADGYYSAGIGSGLGGDMSGSITIQEDATVNATSSDGGAGIGSGCDGEMSGSITIQGNATVSATSKDGGAGIGSGYHGDMSGNITISGNADVTAEGEYSAAIGSGGRSEVSGNITIEGNTTVKAENADDSAVIGSGYNGDMSGNITLQGNAQITTTNGTFDYGYTEGPHTGPAVGSGSGGDMNGTIRIGSNVTLTMNGGTGIGVGTVGKLGEKSAIIYFEEADEAATAGDTSAENETARSLYRVVDKDEKDLPYTETRKDGVLTIHCDRELATVLAKTADLQTLQSHGIHTIVFETENATSTFALEDLLKKGTGTCRLTHDGKTVTFTLGEQDISDILK